MVQAAILIMRLLLVPSTGADAAAATASQWLAGCIYVPVNSGKQSSSREFHYDPCTIY